MKLVFSQNATYNMLEILVPQYINYWYLFISSCKKPIPKIKILISIYSTIINYLYTVINCRYSFYTAVFIWPIFEWKQLYVKWKWMYIYVKWKWTSTDARKYLCDTNFNYRVERGLNVRESKNFTPLFQKLVKCGIC